MHKRVLIADDDQDLRYIWGMMFQDAGYEVYSAVDGRDALRSLRENHPEILVIDYDMPGMCGLDVVRELRQHERNRRTVVILITGTHLRTASDARELQPYVDLMLAKPISPSYLVQIADQFHNQQSKADPPPS